MSAFVVGPNPPFHKLDDSLSIDSTPILSSELQIQDFYEMNTVDAARHRIDQEIWKMEGAIRALRSRRNSLAAISRLPPEVLSRIFVCHAATYELNMDWVKITHVSRHWRTVAIGCPHLWTTLVFARPRWVEEMLKRSKMAPLVIDGRFGSMYIVKPKLTEGVQLAMNHISRVRELNLVSTSAWFGNLLSIVPRAAPMLQALVLSTSTKLSTEPFHINYFIPPELFSDDSSQLRRLELIHCNLDWTSHILRGLTHLKIHNTAPETRPSTPLFLDVLEQLPTLTVLDLKEALPHVADGFSRVSCRRIVELHSLTYLHLSGSDSDCSNALRHLSVPSSATLGLSCRSTAVSHPDFSSILTFVSGLWGPTATISSAAKPHKRPIHWLEIHAVGLTQLSIEAWPRPSFQALSGYPLPSIDLFFQWSSTVAPGIGDKIISEACAALPLEQLVSLDILNARQITEQTWLARFGKLKHLQFICTQGRAVDTLLSAMMAEPRTVTGTTNSSTGKHSSIYFPSLLHLTIEDISFDPGYDNKYAKLEDLKDCLMERCWRKPAVRDLVLSRCHRLTRKHVEELREIVVDVTWDGLVTGFVDVHDSEDDHGDDIDDDMDDSDDDQYHFHF
ncbi:uncharacterized protein LACBIDRAFT_305269 [Laccaria bicolor S238N-H82]|uniref:Predicted protein n=1 Tax=Laccaria bicolor (strain S238N-H82 / ATCC MYA-4686) TaxID=486041 RepID=B0CTU5_LACBS|nr:uncharacterized protein LACBIDRAFT_305269 [Laccaria bicolor S238N-H82]EDR14559.1 predicted protein [Laccaria bicolor S238N-H82]|eukprot:XP_001875118.1 predicted protein [Laccaria bicolor S238N-H82]